MAHTVHEQVTEQATILVNGKLKEYQVIIRHLRPRLRNGPLCTQEGQYTRQLLPVWFEIPSGLNFIKLMILVPETCSCIYEQW